MLNRRPAAFFGGLLLLLFGPLLQECEGDLGLFSGFPTVTVVNGSDRPAAISIRLPGGYQSTILQPGASTSWTSFATDPDSGEIKPAVYYIAVSTSETYKQTLISWRQRLNDYEFGRGTLETAVWAAAELLSIQIKLDALVKESGTGCSGSVEPEQNVTVTVVFNEASNKWACG